MIALQVAMRQNKVYEHLIMKGPEKLVRNSIVRGFEVAAPLAQRAIRTEAPSGVLGLLRKKAAFPSMIKGKGTQIRLTLTDTSKHAFYVINTLGPWRKNPAPYLVPWVKKFIVGTGGRTKAGKQAADKRAFSIAYAIGRSYMKKKRKGNNFILRGWNKIEPRFTTTVLFTARRFLIAELQGKA